METNLSLTKSEMKFKFLCRLSTALLLCVSCGTSHKLSGLRDRDVTASINLGGDTVGPVRDDDGSTASETSSADTVRINVDGREMLIMKAIRDEESGLMVATEQIKAAVVTARFRNVAERHGKVNLQFELRVPEEMYDSKWQIKLSPDMYVLGDSIRLDDILVTGLDYRKAQLRGYQQYENFLARIVDDPEHYIDRRSLEIFLERNIPMIYSLRADTTYVSEEEVESRFGVNEREALEHYTNRIGSYFNERRKLRKDLMYSRYVKAPIVTEHIRLDTVIRSLEGDFIYMYSQNVAVRPKLRKVEMTMSGEILEQGKKVYDIPHSAPLTFYISSLSSFVDGRERYFTKVVERSVSANASWNIDFGLGKSVIDESLGENAFQIANIKDNLRSLVTNDTFELDSLNVAAFASPEGSLKANVALSSRRASSARDYFGRFLRQVKDSVRAEAGMKIGVGMTSDGSMAESTMSSAAVFQDIVFRTTASGENWQLLDHLVSKDSLLSDSDKLSYNSLTSISDPDERERVLSSRAFYPYLKEKLYPLLRTVQFNFYLHRRGMVQDTLVTTVLDSTYMKGVQAIRDRDYETAALLLLPYRDFNAAIALASLDRNVSALSILEGLERKAPVNYMLAIIYSRMGDIRQAVQCYVESCRQDPSFVHRGNLDPEISALIRDYNLNDNNLQL